jgi:uncharacterized protein YuzE
MKTNYDQESDILYIVVKDGPAYDSEELDDDVRVEYDKKGKIVGIEVLNARRNVGKAMAQEIAQRVKTITR